MSGFMKTGAKSLFVLGVFFIVVVGLGKTGLLGNAIMKVAQRRPWWKIAMWIFLLPIFWYSGFGSVERTDDSPDDPADVEDQ